MHRGRQLAFLLLVCLYPTCQAQEAFYIGGRIGLLQTDGLASAGPGLVFAAEPTEFFPGVLIPQLVTVGVNGTLFDDRDSLESIYAGYQFNRHVGLEFGVSDLGEFVPVSAPSTSSLRFSEATLEAHQVDFRARFSLPLRNRLSLSAIIGVSRAQFDTTGVAELLIAVPTCCVGYFASSPLAEPEDEAGSLWGAGLDWGFSRRTSLGVHLLRHDTGVIEIESIEFSIYFDL